MIVLYIVMSPESIKKITNVESNYTEEKYPSHSKVAIDNRNF
jgi:hypothetical protein